MYPEAKVTHLTRCHSDHCPVLLEMQPRCKFCGVRPFRFQTAWLLDPTFPPLVHQAWESNNNLKAAIVCFTLKAREWNKNHFGNIFTRKKNLMSRINGIQRALALKPSTFLVNLENELLKELDVVLSQEEELWALKSRVNWMIQGDNNTFFYHVSTLVRRKRNKIMAIKDIVGNWIHEEDEINNFIRSGFNEIYSTSLSCVPKTDPITSAWQSRLTDLERESISGSAFEEEIRTAVWSLKPFKAPGPDGLHAGFFQKFWPMVGSSVIEEVRKIFDDRKVLEL